MSNDERASSPTPTADYSIIPSQDYLGLPWPFYSPQSSIRGFFPRLWDALASHTSRLPLPMDVDDQPTPRSLRLRSRFKGKARANNMFLDESIDYASLPPLDGEEGELIDDEACFVDVRVVTGIDFLSRLPPELALHILILLAQSAADPPQYHEITSVSSCPYSVGSNRLSQGLPNRYLYPYQAILALRSLLACSVVSLTWHRYARDNGVWRAMFYAMSMCGWTVDLSRLNNTLWAIPSVDTTRKGQGGGLAVEKDLPPLPTDADDVHTSKTYPFFAWNHPCFSQNHSLYATTPRSRPVSPFVFSSQLNLNRLPTTYPSFRFMPSPTLCTSPSNLYSPVSQPSPGASKFMHTMDHTNTSPAPLVLDWFFLFRDRWELDRRWEGRPKVTHRANSTFLTITNATEATSSNSHHAFWSGFATAPRAHPSTSSMFRAPFSRGLHGYNYPGYHNLSGYAGFNGYPLGGYPMYPRQCQGDRTYAGFTVLSPGSPMTHHSQGLNRGEYFDVDAAAGLDEFGYVHSHGEGGEEEAEVPKVMKLSGHTDSVYTLEFSSTHGLIITGSRDRTIKLWCLFCGKSKGSVKGHAGSVLCLKFDFDCKEVHGDGDELGFGGSENDAERSTIVAPVGDEHSLGNGEGKGWTKGFLVSGSSDCSVCVWDLWVRKGCECGAGSDGVRYMSENYGANESGDGSVDGGIGTSDQGLHHTSGQALELEQRREQEAAFANIRAVLKGHTGGVLDLRIDNNWIVSCSKDAVIRIWDRRRLKLYRTLKGHEGPVNAVGLQDGNVVSASGDGKMILWDVESGERVRTFEGHDRGLACIEFKDDYIVSGSNDCKIKIWRASTGECLRTLVGHEALVRALAFDPRSGRLVSASYDKSVRVWDGRTGRMLREFRGSHTSHIFDVKFDVARIVSTSHDQKIVVLDFSFGLDASLFV